MTHNKAFMNKRGKLTGLFDPTWIIVLVSIMVILFFGLMISVAIQGPKLAEEQCKKLDLELFEYSGGNIFSSSATTCWDPYTKETRVIG